MTCLENAHENSIPCNEKPQFHHYIKLWLYPLFQANLESIYKNQMYNILRCIILLKPETILEN